MKNEPAAGEVFWYQFLWKREQPGGETEGRKKRPVCIAVTNSNHHGEIVVFILPITTQPPPPDRKSIEVPQIESQRVVLETHVRKWVMLDEVNTDIVDRSYVWEDRKTIGTFSSVFTSKIQSSLLTLAKTGAASVVDRTKWRTASNAPPVPVDPLRHQLLVPETLVRDDPMPGPSEALVCPTHLTSHASAEIAIRGETF